MKHLLITFILINLAWCTNKESVDKNIKLSSDYIINENWNEIANAIKISKMKLKKDSILNISNLNQVDIINRLEVDSLFIYVANVKVSSGEEYNSKKIYFNKDNGFDWWTVDGNLRTRVIGNLEKGNWYKFSNLITYPYYVYIYLDSLNGIHRFDVNLANN